MTGVALFSGWKKWFVFCFAVLGSMLAGCHSAKKSAQSRVAVCGQDAHASHEAHLDWFSAAQDASAIKDTLLPKAYQVYYIEPEQVKSFFRKANETSLPLFIPLPAPIGCKKFEVGRAETMSAELAAKYPDLISLKGTANGADLRLNYDGVSMHGQVLLGGDVYLVEPVVANNETLYVVYNKKDVTVPKTFNEPSR